MLGMTFTPHPVAGSALASSVDSRPAPTPEEFTQSQTVASHLLREAYLSLRRTRR